jgi:DNA-binding MarR family transcriptional regulator
VSLPSENRVAECLSKLLAEPIGSRPTVRQSPSGNPAYDFIVQVGPYKFLIERRLSSATEAIAGGISRIELFRKSARDPDKFVPIVAVPYMGEVGRLLCQRAGVGWIDLSGNADLVAPGLKIHIEGRPNLFKQTGRPTDVFAPKSSRITRYLLTHPYGAYSIRGLARETEMDPGFTSRIISRLEAQGFVRRMVAKTEMGRRSDDIIVLRDPGLLLDAWRAEYKFFRHNVIAGHVAARASEEVVQNIDTRLRDAGVEYAATGLSGAALLTDFVGARLITFFLHESPDERLLGELGFREDPRGANVWLVVPNDEGVFDGARDISGIRCAAPLQVYLDLKDHPERSAEAAQELRNRLLKWGRNG